MKTVITMCLLLSLSGGPGYGVSFQKQDSFTIIGRTKGIEDGTIFYLKKAESGSLKENLDSAFVFNNSFTFKGSISESSPYTIHTGYTGWEGQPPESFHRLVFWLSNSTIYLDIENVKLELAKISGSQLQIDNNDYNQKINPMRLKLDSITRAIQAMSPNDPTNKKLIAEHRRLVSESFSAEMDFVRSHPGSLISIYILNIYKTTLGKENTKELFFAMDSQIKATEYGNSIKDYIGLQDQLNIGDNFIDIKLPNLAGEIIRLSSIKNKYILLDFWAGWCGPCRLENKNLAILYNAYKQKGFEIYAVSLDTKRQGWENAVHEDKMTWITVSDLKGSANSKIASIYNVIGIPHNYLLDKDGKIIAIDIIGEQLEKKLKELLKE